MSWLAHAVYMASGGRGGFPPSVDAAFSGAAPATAPAPAPAPATPTKQAAPVTATEAPSASDFSTSSLGIQGVPDLAKKKLLGG